MDKKKETNLAPVICEDCETVFMGGPNAFICQKCWKKRLRAGIEKREKKRREKKDG